MNNPNICVLGVTCSGKSTYCQELRDGYVRDNKPLPVLLQMGRFFRNTIGPGFFAELENPAAPDATECWVRNMVYNAQTFAFNYDRDLIIDGFPRTPEQFDWLMLSSLVSSKNQPVKIVSVSVSKDTIEHNINTRKTQNPEQVDLDLLVARVKKDAAMMSRVHNAITEAALKNQYPNLTFEEVQL